MRSALGAGQLRLVRQLFVEGGLLSALGCVLGFGIAWIAVSLIHKLPPDTIPRDETIAIHWPVLLALAGIATLTTVLTSLLPALFVARTDPQPALQAASRGLGSRSIGSRVSGWLVTAEVALSTLLLIATGLLFHTLWNLEHSKLGFDVTRLSTFTAMPADASGFGNMSVSKKQRASSNLNRDALLSANSGTDAACARRAGSCAHQLSSAFRHQHEYQFQRGWPAQGSSPRS